MIRRPRGYLLRTRVRLLAQAVVTAPKVTDLRCAAALALGWTPPPHPRRWYTMKIPGKIALVTGASSGIGAATARALASQGARVVLVARRAAELKQVIDAIGSAAVSYPVDLTDAPAVATTASQIIGEVGHPDILVNNAGAGQWKFVHETTPDEAVAMMAAPYFAAFNTTHPCLLAWHAQAEQWPHRQHQLGGLPLSVARSHGVPRRALGSSRLHAGITRRSRQDGDQGDPVRVRRGQVPVLAGQPRAAWNESPRWASWCPRSSRSRPRP